MKILHGIPAASGLVLGSAFTLRPAPPVDLSAQHSGAAAAEIALLDQAIAQAIALLARLQEAASSALVEILEAQREMLDDPELKERASELITQGFTAEAAVSQVAATYAEQLAALPDDYLAARADDVREAGRRIVAELRGSSSTIQLDQPVILVAQDLSPAELVGLNQSFLQAIVTESGSATGHLAIVAQGLDIPAVVGIADVLAQVEPGTLVLVDGESGLVTIDPGEEQRLEAEKRLEKIASERKLLETYRDLPGLTADGVHIEVFANIGTAAEAHKAVEMGAEGVGLFRTEFIAAQGLPSEEAQYRIYEEVASILRRAVVVRTFDIGGDKPVPGLEMPAEANPFLGWRGIRLGLDRPEEVFLPQVRALLQVAANYDIRIMLPMVTTPQEVEEARGLIARARAELEQAGRAIGSVPLGIMVETPAAALTIDQFAGLIDFASIGTNDLTQYTYAVDRTNPHVRNRAQPLGTAILRLIDQTCRAGVSVAVCGQLASDPEAIPLLVGLGVRELSVAPARVPAVKQILSRMTLPEMQSLAQKALGSW